jgi:ubiquinone/menaquinone biosynthesis C-methylase UbiE
MQNNSAMIGDVVSFPKLLPANGNKSTGPAGHALTEAGVPDYLSKHYWWAYVHPNAVRFFERDWLVNLILWGNYARLRDAALVELGHSLPGSTLQVACVYGDLTARLSQHAARGGGKVDVVDVLPVQLNNLRRKLSPAAPIRLLKMDSMNLDVPDANYDRVLVFFLLHEQPAAVRERTLGEICRVVKPGGKIVIVDYARPRWWQPLRYLWLPVLERIEPFAHALWQGEITDWLPAFVNKDSLQKETMFGGLYQKVVVTR